MVTFTGNTTTGSSSPVSPPVAIIGGSVGGGVLIIAVVFFIVIAIVVVSAIRQAKLKDRRYITLMSQMESMELEMADQCKQGKVAIYTEPQIQMYIHIYIQMTQLYLKLAYLIVY